MIYLYRFLCGFVLVELSGENPEKLLNLAAQHRISVWGFRRRNGNLCFYLSVKSFYKIRKLRRKAKTRIHILNRVGLPFMIHPYRFRYGLFLGGGIFLSLLFLLSNFIWSFEIAGNQQTTKKEILTACQELGIHYGTPKRKINSRILSQKLILSCPNLSWATFNVGGTVLTVEVSERKTEKIDDDEPCNLKASADGIIKKIDVISGTPMVSVGDTVHQGEILVSGITQIGDQTVFSRAEGSVLAEARLIYSNKFMLQQQKTAKTGQRFYRKTVSVFGRPVPLFIGKIKGNYELSSSSVPLSFFGKNLPILLIDSCYEMIDTNSVSYTQEQAELNCYDQIKKQIEKDHIKIYSEE
ncbi:MAG: sporulation protein YqfD [Clostridia bacterium]|nr:sporulation protein YqfD [Clostridia bacterium]